MKRTSPLLILFCLVLAACSPSGATAGTSLAFSKDRPLQVAGVSAATGKGTLSFAAGASASSVRLSIDGEVPVLDQKAICFFCVDTLVIAPGLKIPVEFLGPLVPATDVNISEGNVTYSYKYDDVKGTLVPKDPPEIEKMIYKALVVDYPLMENSANAFVAGDKGATLKKDGKAFTLVEGSAHLLK